MILKLYDIKIVLREISNFVNSGFMILKSILCLAISAANAAKMRNRAGKVL